MNLPPAAEFRPTPQLPEGAARTESSARASLERPEALTTTDGGRAVRRAAGGAYLAGLTIGLASCASTSPQGSPAPRVASLAACAVACDSVVAQPVPLPAGFSDLQQVVPGLRLSLRYLGADNFTGRPVPGYRNARGIATTAAARALAGVQRAAAMHGLGLLVFDAYRPQRAVDAFVAWAADPHDVVQREHYYPRVDKCRLFADGYIAARSGHSRGSTIDLTLTPLPGHPAEGLTADGGIDMGSAFDLFDPISHPDAVELSATAIANRRLLQRLMEDGGFVGLATEWWHFTLRDEPFADTYFDFPVM